MLVLLTVPTLTFERSPSLSESLAASSRMISPSASALMSLMIFWRSGRVIVTMAMVNVLSLLFSLFDEVDGVRRKERVFLLVE